MTHDDLIARHVSLPSRDQPAEARMVEQGVPLWLVVDLDNASLHDTELVARTFDISACAVEAARAYYTHHRSMIDARIALATASFA